jgi:hypothetical protein
MDKSSFPSSERGTAGQGVGGPSFSAGSTYSSTGTDAGLGTGSMGGSAGMGSSETRETVERAKDAAHSTVDRLASTARDWAGKIDERARGMSDVPMRALDYSRSTVQEHPMQAILLSVLLGYVIGRFSGSRSTHFVEY